MIGWTPADGAELDVLVHTLTFDYEEHRAKCRACRPCAWPDRWRAHKRSCRVCQGDAPLTFGTDCYARVRFLEHTAGCPSCSGPCPHLRAAVAVVVDWRNARALLSKAEALRCGADDRPGCCNALSTEIDGVTHYWHRPDCRYPWPETAS